MHQLEGSSRRVLVVEDYDDSARALRTALELRGHAVEIASSGTEAMTKARSGRPEVIICDLGLPDIDGLTLARLIRSDEDLRDVWLIALTAYYVPSHAAEAGFDEYLTKPADIEQLAQHLHDAPPRRLAQPGS